MKRRFAFGGNILLLFAWVVALVYNIFYTLAMLYTNLNHIERESEFKAILAENENVVLICGRMGPVCIPVYRAAEELEAAYLHVKFFDLEYDNPESFFFHTRPEVQDLAEHPFTIFYKNGRAVNAISGVQPKSLIKVLLDKEFSPVSASQIV